MQYRHIVVAADDSDVSRIAVQWSLALADRGVHRLTVLRVVPVRTAHPAGGHLCLRMGEAIRGTEAADLQAWVEPLVRAAPSSLLLELAIVHGVPGIEIARFAEGCGADLLVLGRKPRRAATRLLLGDTADSVARRSRIPCVFVPASARSVQQILAAVDGSERGEVVIDAAVALAQQTDAGIKFVIVEPKQPGEPAELALATPLARTEKIQRHLADRARRQERNGTRFQLVVQRGAPVPGVLDAIAATQSDLLVVGYRRGGPAAVIDAGSTARQLLHAASAVVVTVPI